MNLFLIERDDAADYDEFDSAVVVAATSEEARLIQPSSKDPGDPGYGWVSPDHVKVTYLGRADDSLTHGSVVCASFNAG